MSASPRLTARWALLPAVLLAALACAAPAQAVDSYKLWNHPYDKHDKCVPVKTATQNPPMRWPDFGLVGTGYYVPTPTHWTSAAGETTCTSDMDVRLDLTERLAVPISSTTTAHVYFHKGGQGYNESFTVPYGHMHISDLASPAPAPVLAKSTIDSRGADPVKPTSGADSTGYGPGRACTATYGGANQYVTTSAAGPPYGGTSTWVYRSGSGTGGNFAKYANAGRMQGNGTVSYTPLQWSWVGKYYWRDGSVLVNDQLNKPKVETQGYGAERTILKPGTTVTRCNVASINSRAWLANTGTTVGRVTAIYVKVTTGGNNLYGWLMHSWQRLNQDAAGNYLDPSVDANYGARNCVLAPASDPSACDAGPTTSSPASRSWGCCLESDQSMYTDEYLVSDDGSFRLIMQGDGNLVEYGPTGAVWATNTYSPGAYAIMQTDGNLVLYNTAGAPIWATNTYSPSARLVIQNDGNLVIYSSSGTPVWARW